MFEGGAGETVRKELMKTTELHTILRLPTGIFYAQGVKANVLFFDNKPASKDAWTKDVWIYDYRSNVGHTLKKNPMHFDHLQEFIKLYNPGKQKQKNRNLERRKPRRQMEKIHLCWETIERDKTNLDILLD